jgi:hypothetical protein
MLDFSGLGPQAEVLGKRARKPRMSLEHVNVDGNSVEVKLFLWQPLSRLSVP